MFFIASLFFLSPLYADNDPNSSEGELPSTFSDKLDSISKVAPIEPAEGYEQKASETVRRANDLKLYEAPYWKTLLHYKRSLFHKNKSLVDDPLFFCAKNGKTNPKAELEATIKAFFSPAPKPDERHAIERFPGRFKWLCTQLNLSESDFPYNGDALYRSIIEKVKPGDTYLVFPTGFLKNPASVFGHTFLLVESQGTTRLLANSINYGAVTNISGGVTYALLGLFGGFRGYFGFVPYYEKIKQYANMDMRDIWEYRLDFTEEEKDRMLRHVFDLSGIYSRYFFISENCSYNLLFLIEAARPQTDITNVLSGVVEPIETVKTIYRLGLAQQAEYRPSIYSKVEIQKPALTRKQNRYIKDVCLGKKTVQDFPFQDEPPEIQAQIWNLASDYLTALLNSRKITPEEYRPRFVQVLSARRKLGKIELPETSQAPQSPENAHGSKKISVHGGKDREGAYTGLEFRLTAHEQLERPAGYSSNSELVFGDIDVRYNIEDKKFYLKKALIASVVSLPVSDLYFFNSAMSITAGFDSNPNEDKKEDLAFRAKAMFGTSILPAPWFQPYILAGADSYFSPEYTNFTDLLLGAEAGFITTFGVWKNKISASAMQSPFDREHFRGFIRADECAALSQNTALKAGYSLNTDWGSWWQEFTVSFSAYF
ncbi:Lnb N-terminal periplasmic domain-containing protein [Treponema sp.]|uniref:Lnb N-terminal periplasmic domain-containing protein n=1 Tax=Treponema sp. TaxID=166 RepID=UPI003F00D8C7